MKRTKVPSHKLIQLASKWRITYIRLRREDKRKEMAKWPHAVATWCACAYFIGTSQQWH